MNTAPLTVRKEMSAARVHRTFVTLGMRHLCVVNSHNHVKGIITRKDLVRAAHADERGGGGGASGGSASGADGASDGLSSFAAHSTRVGGGWAGALQRGWRSLTGERGNGGRSGVGAGHSGDGHERGDGEEDESVAVRGLTSEEFAARQSARAHNEDDAATGRKDTPVDGSVAQRW
jgi:CBS domain-containing protein